MNHFLLGLVCAAYSASQNLGVLLLAHGGNPAWNREVLRLSQELSVKYPIEVAFGMGDVRTVQRALDKLRAKRVSKVVAVPLFVSSHSEVFEQIRYVLGIGEKPSKVLLEAKHAHGISKERIKSSLPIVLTSALDAHPSMVKILLERAKRLSREPAKETLVLVAHGPVAEEDNRKWLSQMKELAKNLKLEGGFHEVLFTTLRDDAEKAVKEKATEELRQMVKQASRKSRVLVIPYLIARGGIEKHITQALSGSFYAWSGETLTPHPNIVWWIEESIQRGAAMNNMKKY